MFPYQLYSLRLRAFFYDRPSISVKSFAKECDIPYSTFRAYKSGTLNMSQAIHSRIDSVMRCYGYRQESVGVRGDVWICKDCYTLYPDYNNCCESRCLDVGYLVPLNVFLSDLDS